jgi:molybdopterin-guanine dinucleotide biosynthesis protein B
VAGRGSVQVVHISGSGRNVGKTLLGEKIVAQLAAAGLRVCAVKHVHHGVDFRVKDTGRYLSSGARTVVALGPNEVMIVSKAVAGLADAICWLVRCNCQAVVVEGFRADAERALKAGGCTAYIKPDHMVNVESQCGSWQSLTLEEAAHTLLDLAGRGCCKMSLGGACSTSSLTPCPT